MELYPLNATQEDMLSESDWETMENGYVVCAYYELPHKYFSAEKIAAAYQEVLDKLHYCHAHLVQVEGKWMISEDTDMPNTVNRYQMTYEEWEARKQEFAKPFKILEEPGIRVNIIDTEKCIVICCAHFHLFFDGISIIGLCRALEDVMHGVPLEDQGDICAKWNEQEIASYGSDAYERAKAATLEKLKGLSYTDICRQTDNPWGRTLYSIYLLDNSRLKAIRLKANALSEEQQKKMMPTICVAAYALALGQMAGTTAVCFMTTYHGRTDKQLTHKVFGNFIKSMSLRINTDPEQSVAQLLAQTRTALFGMMRTIGYPWSHMMRDLGIPQEEQTGTEMNVSGSGIYEYMNLFGVEYPCYRIEAPESAKHAFMVVQIREEGLTFNVEGSDALYTKEQLNELARLSGEYTLQLMGNQSAKVGDLHSIVRRSSPSVITFFQP